MAATPSSLQSQTPPALPPNQNQAPSVVQTRNYPPCAPPNISITSTSAVERLHRFFFYYQGVNTKPLWASSPAGQALFYIKIFLQYNPGDVEEIDDIKRELTSICMSFLTLWTTNPILLQQLQDTYHANQPGWHYYMVLFSVSIGSSVTTAVGTKGKLVSFHHSPVRDDIAFLIETSSNQSRLVVSVPGSEVSVYYQHLSFEV
jgi:hypothetical protein